MRRHLSPLDGYGGRDSGVSGTSSSIPSSSCGVQEPASEEAAGWVTALWNGKYNENMSNSEKVTFNLWFFTLVTEWLRDVTDVIYLQRIHGDLFGAVVHQVEFSAFVQGTSELSFPLCRIRFINSLLELPRLHSPRLEGRFNMMDVSVSQACVDIFMFLQWFHTFVPFPRDNTWLRTMTCIDNYTSGKITKRDPLPAKYFLTSLPPFLSCESYCTMWPNIRVRYQDILLFLTTRQSYVVGLQWFLHLLTVKMCLHTLYCICSLKLWFPEWSWANIVVFYAQARGLIAVCAWG